MIIFIANEEIISNYEDWIKNLPTKDFKNVFPQPGTYNLFLVQRSYSTKPILIDVADCTPQIIVGGKVVRYVVE